MTLVERLKQHAEQKPGRVALREKELGIWREVTWARYWKQVQIVGHALLALDLQPGERVAVHADNRREWLYADLGTVAVRGITMGLYPTNPVSEVAHLLTDSGASVLIAEDQEQVDKALEVDAPELRHIVYLEPRGIQGHYDDPRLMSWDEFCELGAAHRQQFPAAILQRMSETRPDDVVTLVYTSGTTGPPKGAMLTHANVEFVLSLVKEDGFIDPLPSEKDLIVSYLPLCHIAERFFTTWLNVTAGVQVNFAESIDTVTHNLREVQPTLLFGVPRIWEKVLATVEISAGKATWLKRRSLRFWLRVADRIGTKLVETGGAHTLGTRLLYALGWLLCFRSLRTAIGMRHVRYAASGAAPIAPEVLKFFIGIGIPMHEVYGMTENSGVATATIRGRVRLGTVGEPRKGVDLRIAEDGEILTRHPGTFAGYWGLPDAAPVDEDGWLHTGDLGVLEDGFLRITGRKKEIIITAGGKNVASAEIENSLKASPYVKEALVIGDRRPYLTALIGIEGDTVGDWARRRRIPYTTYRDLSERQEVRTLIGQVVENVNERLARVEQIKDFRLLPKELGHEEGELTATQKVKRRAVEDAFADLIATLYPGRTS
ncbi:AMP-dependent synthetase/ligase [Actinocorallia populi]|uniref:AMP-dependent synthetase/ligase n=1 Tax=Actinocorallia populi TaxID=2079200 RepID=UPI000D0883A3|nr:AMP-binding protein [Actinocorallia populi]